MTYANARLHRAAAAEGRADDAHADAARAWKEAARQLAQARTAAERERDELHTELERRDREHAAELARAQAAADARATALEEARADLRARAEHAERDLHQARGELARMRQDVGSGETEQAASAILPPRGGCEAYERASSPVQA